MPVRALDPGADQDQQRVIVAIIGIGVLYGLLILFGQFVAQGVVEEKSSRVVELLLATMKPWQLLAGKIVGLGLLGLALHLSGGEKVDEQHFHETPEGREFIIRSSRAWGEAFHAAGATPHQVAATTDATTAFYAPPPQ